MDQRNETSNYFSASNQVPWWLVLHGNYFQKFRNHPSFLSVSDWISLVLFALVLLFVCKMMSRLGNCILFLGALAFVAVLFCLLGGGLACLLGFLEFGLVAFRSGVEGIGSWIVIWLDRGLDSRIAFLGRLILF